MSASTHRDGSEPDGPAYVELDPPVATLVLNRPAALNAIDPATLTAMTAGITRAEDDDRIRALVIRGAGRAFCAGADLGEVAGTLGESGPRNAFQDEWHLLTSTLLESRLPSIAAVHGICVAGGFELMLACDFAVLADDARIGDRHAVYGLIPGGGGSQLLPRRIGERRATWVMMSGCDIPPEEALAIGLVNQVCRPTEVANTAVDMARRLSSRSPVANANIKVAVRRGAGVELGRALGIERAVVADHLQSEDVRIGLDAFARRIDPVFVGR